jgi:fructokinase
MTLSDLFCVERHRQDFLDLIKNKLDIVFANEQEIMSLLNIKKIEEAVSFAKELKKEIIITRGSNGSLAISKGEIVEQDSQNNLKILDLTGAGDLFAAGYLHGRINSLSIKESLEEGTNLSSKIIEKIGARL